MTRTRSALQRRRVSFGIFLPAGLLALAALLWSLVWHSTASRMHDETARWRADMAAHGAQLVCAEETSGGYPFRLAFECTDPAISVSTDSGLLALTAATLRAVAQAYDTGHVIVEIAAPIRLEQPGAGSGVLISAASGVVAISIEFAEGRASRVSAVLPGWRAVFGASKNPDVVAESAGGEIHLRLRPGNDALDLVLSADRTHVMGEAVNGRADVNRIDLVSVINRPQPVTPANIGTWLARWRDAGGVADVRRMFFDSASLAGEGKGTINLTAQGHLEGALNVRFTKLPQFAAELASRGVISADEAKLLAGAVGLFAQTVGGEKAVTLPVRLRDGAVYLGPVKLTVLPALE